MHCYICDKTLSDAEILPSPSGTGYEPCSQCLEIALDAAYCDGFVREESLEEVIEGDSFLPSVIETLDPDIYRSSFDHCDPISANEDGY